jgi:two-component sensor histidine kinase
MNINEVLNKSHPIEKWIKDFVDSDNPKFSGKSKEERIKMAKGAYYSAQKEDISIDEETKKEDLPFDPDPPKKNPSAKAGKYGLGHSVAKHLARQALKKQQGVKEETEEQKKEKEALDLKLAKAKNSQRAAKALGEDISVDEEFHVVGNNSYYGDKQEPVKLSSHKTKDEADAALAKHKAASKTEAGNRTKWHKIVDSNGLKKHMKEEIEELDEISKNLARKYYRKSSNQAMDSIVAKDNPLAFPSTKKDHEKTLNKRIAGMKAAGRRLDNRVPTSEAVEELDELDKKTLGSYVNKAHDQLMKHTSTVATKYGRGDKDATAYALDKDALRKTANRTQGMKTAISKLTKEENLDEISKDTLNSYVHKAFQHGNDLHYDIAHERDKSEKEKMKSKLSKRNDGVIKAAKKLREGISMLSFDDYLKEALHPNQVKLDKNKNGKLDAHDFKKLRKEDQAEEGFVSHAQRKAVWASKNEKGVKEEIELDESYRLPNDTEVDRLKAHVKTNHLGKKIVTAGVDRKTKHISYVLKHEDGNTSTHTLKEEVELDEAAWGKDKMTNLRQAHDRHMEKALAANKAGDDEATKVHQRKMQMIQSKMQKLKQNEEVELGEECEILAELDKKTLGSYVKKASTSLASNAMKAADRTDKKSFRKAVNRMSGIQIAADKLAKEEVEELDELSKSTLGSYVKKASKDSRNKALDVGSEMTSASSAQSAIKKFNKSAKRVKGISTAVDKLTKEETENMKSYKDFMTALQEELDIIDEAKIDDLKDRIAAKKATQSAYDKDYKPSAKSNVMKVKGHSYGAGESDDNDDDEDTKKVSKPASPEVKRGRGRPAGSKSGARN